MGFVWPITDPSLTESTKKRTADGEASADNEGATDISTSKQKVDAPKRQQNNMLLLNAMRATAAHSKMALASSNFGAATEAAIAAEGVPTNARSSATPGPSHSQAATPNIPQNAPTPQDGPKQLISGVKKKKKRPFFPNDFLLYFH
jgi:mediator of RNA polymerase II transcription subunit 6